ncbi:MAG TPA: hypothetical protein VF940_05140 [Streptosporangiaceae bacterium]
MSAESVPSSPARRLRSPARRVVVRLAEVVCPPEIPTGDLVAGLLEEFELLLGALPAGLRWLIPGWLVAFDQGARAYPRARGRRFVRLPDAEADAYFRAVLARRRSGLSTSVQRIKGLIIMCYYELPEVKEQLGYQPDAYIAEVTQRRLATYGTEIRAGEAASLGSDRDEPDSMASPGHPEDGS